MNSLTLSPFNCLKDKDFHSISILILLKENIYKDSYENTCYWWMRIYWK